MIRSTNQSVQCMQYAQTCISMCDGVGSCSKECSCRQLRGPCHVCQIRWEGGGAVGFYRSSEADFLSTTQLSAGISDARDAEGDSLARDHALAMSSIHNINTVITCLHASTVRVSLFADCHCCVQPWNWYLRLPQLLSKSWSLRRVLTAATKYSCSL